MPTIWTNVLRMIHIDRLEAVRSLLRAQGAEYRIRYRGPHGAHQDTLRRNARAFTVYYMFPVA